MDLKSSAKITYPLSETAGAKVASDGRNVDVVGEPVNGVGSVVEVVGKLVAVGATDGRSVDIVGEPVSGVGLAVEIVGELVDVGVFVGAIAGGVKSYSITTKPFCEFPPHAVGS